MRVSTLALSVSAALVASLASTSLYAQDPPVPPPGPLGSVVTLDGLTAEFRPSVGSTTGVGSRGWGLGIGIAATLFGYVIAGGDFGFASVADDSSFTQSTTGGRLESSVSMYYGSLYAGLKTRALSIGPSRRFQVALGAIAGRAAWSGDRSISSCVDCTVQELPVEGGAFVEPFLIIGSREEKFFRGLRVAFRSYPSSGSSVDNVISVGMAAVRGR